MTQKPFGVKQLNVIGAAGTPTIESAGDLNIGGQQVAITTNTSISGVITATAFSGGDGDKINLGDNDDFQIFHHSNGTGIIQNAGSGQLQIRSDEIRLLNQATDEDFAFFRDDGAVELYYDNVKRFETSGIGVTITGETDINGDLNVSGVSTFQSHVHLGDDDELRFGANNDFKIYHDPDDARLENTNGDIKFKNTGSYFFFDENGGETLASFINDGAVNLFYDGNKKFETTLSGAIVTGILTATSFVGDGSSINSLDASNLSSGTIPDARFPATLPAVSGANLTNLPAASVDQNFSGIVTATSFQVNSTTGDGSDRGYTIKYYITSSGASAYRFAGPGVLNSSNNPTLYFHRGFTYILENSTGGSHPFALRLSSGGSSYNPGGNFLTGSTTGTQILTVPFGAPSSIVYQCTLHGGMLGTINFVT